jgi:hypothetical protein
VGGKVDLRGFAREEERTKKNSRQIVNQRHDAEFPAKEGWTR